MIQRLILAAGAGRRFGADKRLARLPDGSTLLEATLTCFCPATPKPLVVLRPGEAAPEAYARQVVVVPSPHWEAGQGHSLAAGAGAWDPTDAPWLMIALGDMPFIAPATLQALEAACQGWTGETGPAPLIAPTFLGRRGHPVLVPARLRSEALALSGDEGLRKLFAREPVLNVPREDPGVCRDVDRPEDLKG